jgi:hypothetical protein
VHQGVLELLRFPLLSLLALEGLGGQQVKIYRLSPSLCSLDRRTVVPLCTCLQKRRHWLSDRLTACQETFGWEWGEQKGMPKKLTAAQEAEIAAQYQKGDSGPLLGRIYGVCPHTVYKAVRRHGITLRSTAVPTLSPQQEQHAVRLYTRWQWPVNRIAHKLGSGPGPILRALQRHNVPLRTRQEANYRKGQFQLTRRQEATVVRRYQHEHMGLQALGNVFGVSGTTIRNILIRHGIERRPYGRTGHRILSPRQEAMVVHQYQQGKSGLNALGEAFGVSGGTIRKILIRHGVERRPVGWLSSKGKARADCTSEKTPNKKQ